MILIFRDAILQKFRFSSLAILYTKVEDFHRFGVFFFFFYFQVFLTVMTGISEYYTPVIRPNQGK